MAIFLKYITLNEHNLAIEYSAGSIEKLKDLTIHTYESNLGKDM